MSRDQLLTPFLDPRLDPRSRPPEPQKPVPRAPRPTIPPYLGFGLESPAARLKRITEGVSRWVYLNAIAAKAPEAKARAWSRGRGVEVYARALAEGMADPQAAADLYQKNAGFRKTFDRGGTVRGATRVAQGRSEIPPPVRRTVTVAGTDYPVRLAQDTPEARQNAQLRILRERYPAAFDAFLATKAEIDTAKRRNDRRGAQAAAARGRAILSGKIPVAARPWDRGFQGPTKPAPPTGNPLPPYPKDTAMAEMDAMSKAAAEQEAAEIRNRPKWYGETAKEKRERIKRQTVEAIVKKSQRQLSHDEAREFVRRFPDDPITAALDWLEAKAQNEMAAYVSDDAVARQAYTGNGSLPGPEAPRLGGNSQRRRSRGSSEAQDRPWPWARTGLWGVRANTSHQGRRWRSARSISGKSER